MAKVSLNSIKKKKLKGDTLMIGITTGTVYLIPTKTFCKQAADVHVRQKKGSI